MIDSEQNIQNHVLPHILSQISLEEFKFLEKEFENYKKKDYFDMKILEYYTLSVNSINTLETENLERLKLIKLVPSEYSVTSDKYTFSRTAPLKLKKTREHYIFTELGFLFIKACQEKTIKRNNL